VPRKRQRILRRHLRRAFLRIGILLCLDAGILFVTLAVLARVTPQPALVHPIAAMLVGLAVAGAYGSGRQWRGQGRVSAGVVMGTVLSWWALVDASPGLPRLLATAAIYWLVVTTMLVVGRWLLDRAVFTLRPKISTRSFLVLGTGGADATSVAREFHGLEGIRVVGTLHASDPEEVWDYLSEHEVETVLVVGQLEGDVFEEVVRATTVSGAHLLTLSRFGDRGELRPDVVWFQGRQFHELSFPALTGQQVIVKRVMDLVCAAAGLILLLPLFALVGLLIRMDSAGPVFFVHDRIGFGGEIFRMYKFRTMRRGADEEKAEMVHLNASGDTRIFKIPEDPRVTRVGRVLRRWSIDELPQLWNVLKGEMSLVGPRPFFEADLEDYRDHHFSRLAAKPGLTGLWQVKGRSEILDFEEVVRLDLEYVYRWSLYLDLSIIMQSVPAVLRRTGAN
jgi:exopolysaccharide biosynthesis polyprenyl glycosylphosphotransferase